MNKDLLFSSKSDQWSTPEDFFDKLNAEFHFSTDVCATPENAKCANFFTPEQDGLAQKWEGCCWCNPPYGRHVGEWVKKAWASSQQGATVVMLLPARTDTRWFHRYINERAETRFIPGRLKFGGCKNAAPFPSMVCIFRPTSNRIESDTVKGVEIDQFNWISFDERFPDDTMLEKAIIVCIKNRWNEQRVDTVHWHGNEQRLSNPWFWGDVTHWMPLPTPPTEEPT